MNEELSFSTSRTNQICEKFLKVQFNLPLELGLNLILHLIYNNYHIKDNTTNQILEISTDLQDYRRINTATYQDQIEQPPRLKTNIKIQLLQKL